jgi:hypothetical protein
MEEEEIDLAYGGLLPRVGRHILAKQDGEVKDSLTAAKREADDSQVAAAGASSDEKAEATGTGSGDVRLQRSSGWRCRWSTSHGSLHRRGRRG